MLKETEETVDFVSIFFILEGILIGGVSPLGHANPCHPLKYYRQAWRNDFQSFQSLNIGINAQKTPQKFDVKEVAFKKYHKKNFTRFYIFQDTLLSLTTLFWCDEFFFPFSSEIPYAYFLNGPTPEKKLH